MTRAFWILVLVAMVSAISISGCGYRLANRASNLPDDISTVHVELFDNRTYEPYLENRLTDQVMEEFARHGVLRPVAREAADATLNGVIGSYVSEPISYDREDDITEYRSRLEVVVSLRRRDTEDVIWKGELVWSEEYPASQEKVVQEDNEAAAIGVIAERIAEELHFRVVENF